MTQKQEDIKRIAELNTYFLMLNDKGQDAALTILKSLEFAQIVMCPPKAEQSRNPPKQTA